MDIKEHVASILAGYDPAAPQATADALRALWLQFEPRSVDVIKTELREKQETVGVPVAVLRTMGKEIGKSAHKRVGDFCPLARLLWDEYGREGKGVAVDLLGPMELAERLLLDEEVDVKKAVSFAIRLCARGEVALVRDFLACHVPPQNPAATWVLCDAVRSMAKKLLPEFVSLLPLYEQWAADSALDEKDRRSVESAVRMLR
jgi:hypothetical protein